MKIVDDITEVVIMQKTAQVTEYKIGNAIVRMHGTPDRGKLEAATLKFMKQVQLQKKRRKDAGVSIHG